MFSLRFNRPVVLTRHAAQRMQQRQIDEPLLLRVIDKRDAALPRFQPSVDLVESARPQRQLVVCGAGAGRCGCCEDGHAPLGADALKTTYFDQEDTLVIQLSDKPIVREVSQDWNTHISYAADGTVVETVILEAAERGAWPLRIEHRAAA